MDVSHEALVLPELLGDIDGLEEKATEFEAEAASLIAKADAIRQIVAGLKTLNGDAARVLVRRSFESHKLAFETRPLDAAGPRGPKAVIAVMSEQPDRTWKVVDVKREMLRRGWATTPKAVEASIKRLRANGALLPDGYGFYRLATAAPKQQEAA